MIPLSTKQVLRKLGGDKISGKVITFDGNLEGKKVYYDTPFGTIVKISEKETTFNNVKSITYVLDNATHTTDDFQTMTEGDLSGVIVSEMPLVISVGGHAAEVVYNVEAGTYIIYFSDTHYATRIQLAETIHPIDPKFLPPMGGGGGFERIAVDVSTAVDGVFELSESESAAFQAAADAGKDAIVFFGNAPLKGVFASYFRSEELTGGLPIYSATRITFNGSDTFFAREEECVFAPAALAEMDGDGWVCMVTVKDTK